MCLYVCLDNWLNWMLRLGFEMCVSCISEMFKVQTCIIKRFIDIICVEIEIVGGDIWYYFFCKFPSNKMYRDSQCGDA